MSKMLDSISKENLACCGDPVSKEMLARKDLKLHNSTFCVNIFLLIKGLKIESWQIQLWVCYCTIMMLCCSTLLLYFDCSKNVGYIRYVILHLVCSNVITNTIIYCYFLRIIQYIEWYLFMQLPLWLPLGKYVNNSYDIYTNVRHTNVLTSGWKVGGFWHNRALSYVIVFDIYCAQISCIFTRCSSTKSR